MNLFISISGLGRNVGRVETGDQLRLHFVGHGHRRNVLLPLEGGRQRKGRAVRGKGQSQV